MRTIAGLILVLAGVIPLSIGVMLGGAQWYKIIDTPRLMQVGGAIGILVGIGVFLWGDSATTPNTSER